MTTMSHERPVGHRAELFTADMWASIAIAAMWLAVLFTAIWGPDLVSHTNDGTSTTIPSAILVALFATIGTWAVAKHGFHHGEHD